MAIVKAQNLTFEYVRRDDDDNVSEVIRAVDGVDMEVNEGEFIAILGHNGSGKSTLAKHINALLYPTQGTIFVDGMNTTDEEHTFDIRQTAGMVFQNPDNQIIGTVVDEDVAFGPENLGVPTSDIWERVEKSLKSVGMYKYREYSPNKLSGGQKQRVAIAGVLAMKPKCIVLDEPTAMLDPLGRNEVINTLIELNRKEKVTIILITHYMNEVVNADKVFVMDSGRVVLTGTPKEIFSQVKRLKELRLDVPQVTWLAHELKQAGVQLPDGILTKEDFLSEIRKFNLRSIEKQNDNKEDSFSEKENIMNIENLTHIYEKGTDFERIALDNVSFNIKKGEFIGLIGHTGSGKSTLIQHLNGLVKANEGTIYYDGENIYGKDYNMVGLRSKVGLVFQYPEYQLFEETVYKDVCYGPKNLGLSDEEIKARADKALESVGFPKNMYQQSPFDLSGGQKRRVAIAGVLAMNPQVLILDEPTAGLDPRGRDEILNQIDHMHKTLGITVILVSHSMEDVAKYADRLLVMNDGKLLYQDETREVFKNYKELEKIGLSAPQISYVMQELGIMNVVSTDEAKSCILEMLKEM